MKKLFLAVALVAASLSASAATVWDFTVLYPSATTVSQGVTGNLGAFIDPTASTPKTSFTVDVSAKTFPAGGTFAGGSLASRLKLGGGGGGATATVYMPSKNFLYFNVTGSTDITVFGRSSSAFDGTTKIDDGRILYITDGTNLLGSYDPTSDEAFAKTVSYTGGAGVIYVFGYINAFNIYRVEASANVGTTTEITSGIKDAISSDILKKAGDALVNPTALSVEVYSVTGVKVLTSAKTSINVSELPQGVYVAKTAKGSLKFIK